MHILPLEKDFKYIWKNVVKKSRREEARQAERLAVEIRDAASEEDVQEFYSIYAESTRRWGYGTPPDPIQLYENLLNSRDAGIKFRLATVGEEIIGGVISLGYGKSLFGFKSVFRADYGKYHATTLLYRDAIEIACEEGYAYLNLGASVSSLPGHRERLMKLKESYGARKVGIKTYQSRSRLGHMLCSCRKWLES
ncbi:MAG: GNAT family N-acetyltransferase [Methanomicrobiales archaeon]|nr:GNAT family N-acetyltransferase [Methanomicrobiales archaeon]MDI6877537.1 GNAT family N-acetyltransferase [Methanomicrobiales archaeon]